MLVVERGKSKKNERENEKIPPLGQWIFKRPRNQDRGFSKSVSLLLPSIFEHSLHRNNHHRGLGHVPEDDFMDSWILRLQGPAIGQPGLVIGRKAE